LGKPQVKEFQCGKLPHVFDERTVVFSRFMDSRFHAPSRFDFDKGRAEIPFVPWGDGRWPCDVTVSQANQLLRFGRIDQKRTLAVRSQDVIQRYKRIAGESDQEGISALDAMRNWRSAGWNIRGKNYKISLYGEIEPNEHGFLRTAIYIFRGVHIGLMLPQAVRGPGNVWDYDGQRDENWKPGSLGGVLAYCKAYTPTSYELLLWGRTFYVSNRFVDRFSDEAWIAAETLDYWGSQVLDLHSLVRMYPQINDIQAEKEVRG
jgi:hypothetical protein